MTPSPTLTPTERRVLTALPPHASECCAASLAPSLDISYNYATACLNRLFDLDLASYEVRNRTRRWYRRETRPVPTVSIRPSRNIDDSIADLQTLARDCQRYQQALHAIANILSDCEIHLPNFTEANEEL
jgi:hypothetical protein